MTASDRGSPLDRARDGQASCEYEPVDVVSELCSLPGSLAREEGCSAVCLVG
jgi:hypothetical protein